MINVTMVITVQTLSFSLIITFSKLILSVKIILSCFQGAWCPDLLQYLREK